jgi:integrase
MPRKKATKKTRGRRGDGSVFPDRRRGGYTAKAPVGRYENGKTKYKEVWAPTYAEAVAKKNAVLPPGPGVTVAAWAERWLAGLDVRPGSLRQYTTSVRKRIVPTFGHLALDAVTLNMVKVAAKGWVTDETGPAAVNHTLAHGGAMYAEAIKEKLTTDNPFADCPRLQHRAKEMDPFSAQELRAIVGGWRKYACGPLLALLAGTGCREGEAAALDVRDYDPVAGTVKIARTWEKRVGLGPPKSKHGYRTLTVPEAVRPAVLFAIRGRTSGVLFASRTGSRYDNAQVYTAFGRLLDALSIRRRNPHQMRHACISLAIAANVPIANVARDAGDSVATIIRTYCHATAGEGIADAMSRILG